MDDPNDPPSLARAKQEPVINRPRVMQRLFEAATYPIVLVIAPAGFGKTTAIRQLLSTRQNAVLVATPSGANTLSRFVFAFARACSAVVPSMSSPPNEFTEPNNPEQELELYSAWAIANLQTAQCTIAIDDLHHVEQDKRIAELLVRLTDACKDNIQWILASRSNALLPRVRWQAYGVADAAITADDLRMSHDEACRLASTLNSPVSPQELAGWVSQTSGFPVPLTYAIRASARRSSIDGIADGMRSLTFHFLAEQPLALS